MADRKFRKLIVSVRPKEREELVEKKRSLMVRSYLSCNTSRMLSVPHFSNTNSNVFENNL